jgi:hypothetical protein
MPRRILPGVVIIGTLAIVGFLLLIVQMLFGGVLNRLTHDSHYALVPLALGLLCLAMAFTTGLAKGPAAVRVAVLCGLGSLAFFGYAVMALDANTAAPYLAASAALLILAITLGIFAYTNEQATSRESSVRE